MCERPIQTRQEDWNMYYVEKQCIITVDAETRKKQREMEEFERQPERQLRKIYIDRKYRNR